MAEYSKDTPLVSATLGNVGPQAVDDGSSAYGTAVTAAATKWILGTAYQGRRIKVVVQTGALTSTPTALKVSLFTGGTDTSGTSAAEVASTITAWATPAGNTMYSAEIDTGAALTATTVAQYCSLALTSNGGGSTSIIAGASAHFLDPTFKS